METNISKHAISLSDLKVSPDKVVNHAKEELEFTTAIIQGLLDIENGKVFDMGDVKKQFLL